MKRVMKQVWIGKVTDEMFPCPICGKADAVKVWASFLPAEANMYADDDWLTTRGKVEPHEGCQFSCDWGKMWYPKEDITEDELYFLGRQLCGNMYEIIKEKADEWKSSTE